MTLKATIPLDAIRVHLDEAAFAESFAYTKVDLTGSGSDVTTTVTGLFDPALDADEGEGIETAIELLIADGSISRITMRTDTPTGLFAQGETITGSTSGNTGTYIGQAAGILYFKPVVGVFVLSETVTGADSGATWGTHLSNPAVAVEGIAGAKAGDTFVARGYRWQIDAVDAEVIAGSHLIGATRGAVVIS